MTRAELAIFGAEDRTLADVLRTFDSQAASEVWLYIMRWPKGAVCPFCGSESISRPISRRPQPYRCGTCRKYFGIKTGSALQDSKLPLAKWAVALHLYSTDLGEAEVTNLHCGLGISQRAAWHLAHRICESYDRNVGPPQIPMFSCPTRQTAGYRSDIGTNPGAPSKSRCRPGSALRSSVSPRWFSDRRHPDNGPT